jgi:bacillithiol system protein YtxJ
MDLWREIQHADQLNDLICTGANGHFKLILKHSHRCALSTMVKSRVERQADPRIDYYLIDVINSRNVSNELASLTDIIHESPQAFLFEGDRLIEVKSHLAISPAEIARRLDLIKQI